MGRATLAAIGTAALTALAMTPLAANAVPAAQRWPSRIVLGEPLRLSTASQAIDSADGADFVLAPVNGGATFRLRRTVLATGRVKLGTRFPVPFVAVGAGWIWVYGGQAVSSHVLKFKLYQVSPSTLAVIRSWTLSRTQAIFDAMGFSPGENGEVVVGFLRKVLTIDARSGAIARTLTVASGVAVSDVSIDGRFLYVAASKPGGSTEVFEYNARTGRLLASNGRPPLRFSAGGSRLTAAPGGVWVSFRTGMHGVTVLLRQQGLRFVRLPGTGTTGDLFAWDMSATTEKAGRSVFLVKQGGEIGCMDTATGHIRARGTVPALSQNPVLIGSAGAGRVLYGASLRGVIAITPPSACR